MSGCQKFAAPNDAPPSTVSSTETDAAVVPEDADAPDAVIPFEAIKPASYVLKVKSLLVGMPPTDDEVAQVTADPAALAKLVDAWIQLPEYQAKMLWLFRGAFQQIQVSASDFSDQFETDGDPLGSNPPLAAMLLQNLNESFSRTAWELAKNGQPFNGVTNTEQLMMTVPLMMYYAALDAIRIDDNGRRVDKAQAANAAFSFKVQSATPMTVTAATVDPASPNYMVFYNPNVGKTSRAGITTSTCLETTRTYNKDTARNGVSASLFNLMLGALARYGSGTTICETGEAPRGNALITDAEFTTWKMVTIRKPKAGEATTKLYDLNALRTKNEVVLDIPRVGFFSTPAFFANWPTNKGNQARVVMNQTLIVALGKAFDGTKPAVPVSEAALDAAHAGPNTPCYSCHRTLDPMRQYFRQAFSFAYHEQTTPAVTAIPGMFAFDAVSAAGTGLADLGAQLGRHPRFAQAWTQRLCYFANSAACNETDPEFLRIAAAFRDSGYKWNVLVKELFSSPIVTYADRTLTASETSQPVAVSRRDGLCFMLSTRLGVPNICGIEPAATYTAGQTAAKVIANGIPADGYSRGAEAPALANDPSLFFRAGIENLCRVIADQLIDAPTASKYASTQPDAAIADFAHQLMGLTTSDPRYAEAVATLRAHFDAAKAPNSIGPSKTATAKDALKSTFMLACTSAAAVGIGL